MKDKYEMAKLANQGVLPEKITIFAVN